MASDLAALVEACRDWVPVDVDDETILAALDRNGNDPEKAALSICRRALNALATGQQTFSVAGDYSQTDTLTPLLTAMITRLENRTGDTKGMQQPITSAVMCPKRDLHRGRPRIFPNLR